MSWNRLTNCERKELYELPVWTTEEDRRRALSYADHPLEGTLEAVRAISTGAPVPKNLGLLVAVARYEDAGWMPDGCFERWRRWERNGSEQLDVAALVQWLDTHESTLQRKLRDLETHLMNQCHQQEKELAMAQSGATLAQHRLHTHREKQILARLSIGDLNEAVQIAQRMPAGPARNEIDKRLRAHSALPNLPARSPTPAPDDLTDEDVRSLETTASWMCNARGAALTENDQQRVGHKIERALAELRRHRGDPQVTCPAVSGATTTPTKDLTNQHMSDLLSGYSGAAGTDVIERMVHEIRRRREDERELAERRRLDAVRRAEIDELVARRQADLCAEEREALTRLKQLMESAAYCAHKDGPVLVALVDRLLGAR